MRGWWLRKWGWGGCWGRLGIRESAGVGGGGGGRKIDECEMRNEK